MTSFTNKNTVSIGENNLGQSPYGTISVGCTDSAGTVGFYEGATFFPHPDGAIATGEMLTFEIGRGRVIGFNATTAGTVAIMEV